VSILLIEKKGKGGVNLWERAVRRDSCPLFLGGGYLFHGGKRWREKDVSIPLGGSERGVKKRGGQSPLLGKKKIL